LGLFLSGASSQLYFFVTVLALAVLADAATTTHLGASLAVFTCVAGMARIGAYAGTCEGRDSTGYQNGRQCGHPIFEHLLDLV